MSLSKLKSREAGRLPCFLTQTVNAEEWRAIHWPPFLLTLSDYNSCTQAIYNLVKMSPWAPSPYLAILYRDVWHSECMCERVRANGRGEMENLRKIRNESKFRQAAYRVSTRLTSFTWVLHPEGLIPLTTRPCSSLTMPGDVRDVDLVSTDVHAVCVVLKPSDNVIFGS